MKQGDRDGCELSSSCLNCRLPKCRYDDPGWMHRERRKKRDRAVIQARERGLTILRIAERFRVSKRTISRILAERA